MGVFEELRERGLIAQLTDEAVAQARARRHAATSDRALKDLFVALEEAKVERDELLTR